MRKMYSKVLIDRLEMALQQCGDLWKGQYHYWLFYVAKEDSYRFELCPNSHLDYDNLPSITDITFGMPIAEYQCNDVEGQIGVSVESYILKDPFNNDLSDTIRNTLTSRI